MAPASRKKRLSSCIRTFCLKRILFAKVLERKNELVCAKPSDKYRNSDQFSSTKGGRVGRNRSLLPSLRTLVCVAQNTVFGSGSDSTSSTCRRSFSGCHVSSESRKAT